MQPATCYHASMLLTVSWVICFYLGYIIQFDLFMPRIDQGYICLALKELISLNMLIHQAKITYILLSTVLLMRYYNL